LADDDQRQEMPTAELLSLETERDGVFLYRFRSDSTCVGDTRRQSVEEAQQQAGFEFGSGVSDWVAVLPDVNDPVAFALKHCR
jgi:hypothetical protein